MKYLQKYKESKEEDKFLAFTKIQNEFKKDKVKKMVEDEIREWIPDNEDINFYYKSANGEAEDVIINIIIDWYEQTYNKLSEKDHDEVKKLLINEYDILNFKY